MRSSFRSSTCALHVTHLEFIRHELLCCTITNASYLGHVWARRVHSFACRTIPAVHIAIKNIPLSRLTLQHRLTDRPSARSPTDWSLWNPVDSRLGLGTIIVGTFRSNARRIARPSTHRFLEKIVRGWRRCLSPLIQQFTTVGGVLCAPNCVAPSSTAPLFALASMRTLFAAHLARPSTMRGGCCLITKAALLRLLQLTLNTNSSLLRVSLCASTTHECSATGTRAPTFRS